MTTAIMLCYTTIWLFVSNFYFQKEADDIKKIVGKLSQLRNEMMTNKVIRPLEDAYSDAKLWNSMIKDLKALDGETSEPCWFNTPWLTVECYLYRRIFEALRKRYI